MGKAGKGADRGKGEAGEGKRIQQKETGILNGAMKPQAEISGNGRRKTLQKQDGGTRVLTQDCLHGPILTRYCPNTSSNGRKKERRMQRRQMQGDMPDEKGGEVAAKETAEIDRPVLLDAGVEEET